MLWINILPLYNMDEFLRLWYKRRSQNSMILVQRRSILISTSLQKKASEVNSCPPQYRGIYQITKTSLDENLLSTLVKLTTSEVNFSTKYDNKHQF